MRVADSQLKAFILDGKIIKEHDMEKAEAEAKKTGKSLREVIVGAKLIEENELRKLEAYILGIPFVDLAGEQIDSQILNIIPEPIARKNNIVAFKKTGQELQVAMLDPEDIQTIEFIRKKANLKILPRLTTPESMKAILKQYQKSLETEFGEIIKKEAEGLAIVAESDGGKPEEDLKKMAEDLPIIRIVDTLIRHAILQSASDIHIEPAEKEVMVRYRIDGILHDAMTLPKQVAAGVVARIKVMSSLKLDEHRLPQDGRFKIETEEYRISFRVSILPVFDGEKIVIRLLPENAKGFTLEALGFNSQGLDRIHRAIRRPTGIILATGPTGSGKTTTLYTILDILNRPEVNISTVEDPIEYRMPRINQTQVRPEIGFSFANGLRSLLRQDPNIIMVGEIRDNETASLAINAALTGHLVLSTLHTNSAAGALPRLLDMNVEPFLLVSTINAIIAQRLVRTLCPEKDMRSFTDAEYKNLEPEVNFKKIEEVLAHERITASGQDIRKVAWGHPKISAECADGYHGRIGIHETLEMSPTLQDMVMRSATSAQIEEQAKKEGMITMLEDGFMKAAQGTTSLEEVLRVTSE